MRIYIAYGFQKLYRIFLFNMIASNYALSSIKSSQIYTQFFAIFAKKLSALSFDLTDYFKSLNMLIFN